MKMYPKFTPQNEDRYFHEGVSWNNITMRMFSPTYLPKGCIFNNKMPAVFSDNHIDILKLAGFMSSKVCDFFTWLINPSVSCSAGVVRKIPICSFETWGSALPETCIRLSRADWDSFETSWDFQIHPLLRLRPEGLHELRVYGARGRALKRDMKYTLGRLNRPIWRGSVKRTSALPS